MKLHIGNLAKATTDAELKELISAYAPPVTLEIIRDSAGTSKGFAFAEFSTDEEAHAVVSGLNGKEVAGNELRLGEARPKKGAAQA